VFFGPHPNSRTSPIETVTIRRMEHRGIESSLAGLARRGHMETLFKNEAIKGLSQNPSSNYLAAKRCQDTVCLRRSLRPRKQTEMNMLD